MNTPSVAYPRPRVRTRVDHASVTLFRLVMADGWRPEQAARELLSAVHGDRRVLALVRAKLSRAVLERPTRLTERATRTVEQALSTTGQSSGSVLFPRQGGAHA
jgi:hypothetical protein